jgi:hypothetical protein
VHLDAFAALGLVSFANDDENHRAIERVVVIGGVCHMQSPGKGADASLSSRGKSEECSKTSFIAIFSDSQTEMPGSNFNVLGRLFRRSKTPVNKAFRHYFRASS